jgi:sec-independent protein translocase protein TatA
MGISWQELVLLLIIVLVLFGPKRLPEVGRSLGNGIREFRDSMSGNASPSVRTEAVEATGTATPAPVEVTVDSDATATPRS